MTTIEKTTTGSNNTNIEPVKTNRMYLLTVNEKSLAHYKDIEDYLTGLKSFNYLLTTEHIGQDNKHYHIAVQFNNPIKLSIKKLYGAHIDPMKYGSIQNMIKYCKCEDDKHKRLGISYELINEIREPKYRGGLCVRDVLHMNQDDILDTDIRYYNIIQKIKQEHNNDIDVEDLSKNVKVYYIYGPSGVGKTSKAKDIFREHINEYPRINRVKCENGFWLGVGNSKACLYDDFRDSHMKASEFINFIDYNKQIMNIKGGNRINEYELIVITSIQSPYDIYKNMDDEPRRQWIRRLEIIDMTVESDIDKLDIDIDELE